MVSGGNFSGPHKQSVERQDTVRIHRWSLLVTGLTIVACAGTEKAAITQPPRPRFAHVQDLLGTPDLIVDGKRLADSWVVYDETFQASFCSVQEGGVSPGDHRV